MKAPCWFSAPCLLLAACASVSVKDAHEVSETPIKMPEIIYVEKFSMEGAKVEIDKQGKELEEYKQQVVNLLHTRLVDRLPEIAPVEEYKGGPLPTEGWLIQGKFTWVNHGTKAARVLVGFGLGATKMETSVRVTELSGGQPREFLNLATTGGSNAEPGLVGSLAMPGGGVSEAVAGSAAGAAITFPEDALRTAREIRNYLVDYIEEHNLAPNRKFLEDNKDDNNEDSPASNSPKAAE
ncbi:MAG: DUF4410 domain-containing protein [Chitinophagales bacterium]|nr:DUF4410 domain-containing protein [Chitinophagales bacterium]